MDITGLEKALKAADERGDEKEARQIAKAIQEIQAVTEASGMAPTIANLRQRQSGATAAQYMGDKAKAGVAGFAGLYNFVADAATGGQDPNAMGDLAKTKVQNFLGYQDYKAPSNVAELGGAVTEMASDPLSYVFGPGKMLTGGAADAVKAIGSRAASGVLPAIGAKAGELMTTSQSPAVQAVAQAVGAIAGSVGSMQVARIPKLVGSAKSGMEYLGPKGVEQVSQKASMLAEQHVKSILRAAVEADPNLAEEIVKLQAKNNAIGRDLPLSSIANNPVIKAAIASMAFKDAKFAAQFTRQFEDAKTGLAEASSSLFGDPVAAKTAIETALEEANKKYSILQDVADQGQNAARLKQQQNIASIQAEQQRLKTSTDQQLYNESRPLAPSWMGPTPAARATNLINMPADKISVKAPPLYEAADAKAAELNAVIPEAGVKSIYDETLALKADDVFKSRFPSIWASVEKNFKPKVDPENPGVEQFNPASYADYRSLDSSINTALAGLSKASPTFGADKFYLLKLKETVNQVAEKTLPDDVLGPLKQANKQYAYDRTLHDIGEEVFNAKGQWDDKLFEKWIREKHNRTAVQNLVEPETDIAVSQRINEVRGRLGAVSANSEAAAKMLAGRLQAEKNSITSPIVPAVQQHILKVTKMAPQDIVSRMYKDTRFAGEIMDMFGAHPPVQNALKAWMLDDIVVSPESVKLFTEDKNKVATFARVFGMQELPRIQQLAELADTLKRNPTAIQFDLRSPAKDILEQHLPGVSIPSFTAKMRSPIISTKQAVVELFSRALATRTELDYEKRLKQLILDPQKINDYVAELKHAIDTKEPIKATSTLGRLFNKMVDLGVVPDPGTAPSYLKQGAVIGGTQQREQAQ